MREIIHLATHRAQELIDITDSVRAVVSRSSLRIGETWTASVRVTYFKPTFRTPKRVITNFYC
jgi:thiamine phosphate synthase YjbQ (UPF0047 family)